MKLDVSNGTCLSHDDPDIWFAGEVDLADPSSSVISSPRLGGRMPRNRWPDQIGMSGRIKSESLAG